MTAFREEIAVMSEIHHPNRTPPNQLNGLKCVRLLAHVNATSALQWCCSWAHVPFQETS